MKGFERVWWGSEDFESLGWAGLVHWSLPAGPPPSYQLQPGRYRAKKSALWRIASLKCSCSSRAKCIMEGEGGGEGTWTQGGTSEAPQSTPEPGTGAAATRSIRVIGCYRRRSARGCTRVHQLNWLTHLLPATQDVAAAHAKAARDVQAEAAAAREGERAARCPRQRAL